jgi:protein NrfC
MDGDKKSAGAEPAGKRYTRRDFLVTGGAVAAVDAFGAGAQAKKPSSATAQKPSKNPGVSYPASKGYLVYDSKKCAGCVTCMLSCSLVHQGKENLSLARIQVIQNAFGKFPDDLKMAVCRQCVTPVFVQQCPTGAAFVDSAHGNVRRIDLEKCIGCKTCLSACPQQPNRTVFNPVLGKSSKCDLCLDTPYWNEKGGPSGKQACVEACPMKAIKFVAETPDQTETDGYDINLRNEHWLNLGLVETMDTVPPLFAKTPPPAFAPANPRKENNR